MATKMSTIELQLEWEKSINWHQHCSESDLRSIWWGCESIYYISASTNKFKLSEKKTNGKKRREKSQQRYISSKGN